MQAPMADLQFYGSYSRMVDGKKESWKQLCDRVLHAPDTGLFPIGNFTPDEMWLIEEQLKNKIAFCSGRFMWCGGTEWLKKPENWSGVFNCVTRSIKTIEDFALCMELSMQGCGVGAVLEPKYIDQLPPVLNRLKVEVIGSFCDTFSKQEKTIFTETKKEGKDPNVSIIVGDSREGWVKAYELLIRLAMREELTEPTVYQVKIDISNVRGPGVPLKGFGGVSNPEKLPRMFERTAEVLNGAVGRNLNTVEVCLLLDEPALAVVAGGVRRSAGIRMGVAEDEEFAIAKQNLWQESADGKWRIDPKREALQMANHTRIFHEKPDLQTCINSVRLQWQSGEGAIMWAREAIARANADLFQTQEERDLFLNGYSGQLKNYVSDLYFKKYNQAISIEELIDRLMRYGLNPCGEVIQNDNHCNLATIALGMLDPVDLEAQDKAFAAASLQALAMLKRNFIEERFARSRDLDPIILVSFTEAFDFFTRALGVRWVEWWMAGRPDNWGKKQFSTLFEVKLFDSESDCFMWMEEAFLTRWRKTVERTVADYCTRHGLKIPNRCTGVKPEGSITLLTGVGCCGVHPPKSWRYIRRKEFRKNDPVALAALDYGYSVKPLRGDKDEDGNLLEDPMSPRCTGWVVEVPVEEHLVELYPELEKFPPSKFPAVAQFRWFNRVQRLYAGHNVSSTLEIRKHEIEEVGHLVHEAIQKNQGYVSMTMLARYDDHKTFPRLPFEPISKEQYELEVKLVHQRRKSDNFYKLICQHSNGIEYYDEAACSAEGCLV